MNLSNLSSGPLTQSSNSSGPASHVQRQSIRHGGRLWLRLFSVLILSSMLLSPAGMLPARAAVPVPVLSGPADNYTATIHNAPPVALPEFSWQPAAGATKYRIQFSSTVGFSTYFSFTTTNTTFTPFDLGDFPDGTWYWRVRVESPAIGEYSDYRGFKKDWASTDNAPALVSPAADATLGFYDAPTFSWTSVTGAAQYNLQVSASPGIWSTLVVDVDTLSTTYQPLLKLPNKTYYWRVVPLDANARPGRASAERRFIAGYSPTLTLLEPNPNVKTFPVFTPTFRWTAVRGAETYRLQYATDAAFTANLVTINTKNTSYTPVDTLFNDQDYYWRVGLYSGDSALNGLWTAAAQPFRTSWYIAPQLLTPRNNYQHVRFPLFSWTPVPGAAYYIVEIDFDVNFSAPIYITSEKTANTFYTPVKYLGDPLTYFWRVTAYDSNGRKGSTSAHWSYHSDYSQLEPDLVYPPYYYRPDTYPALPGVTTDPPLPEVTTNPHEDRTVPLPVFIWHHSLIGPGVHQGELYPDSYQIQVSSDENFATVDWTTITENTIAAPTPDNPFDPSILAHPGPANFPDSPNTGVYFWRVRGMMDGGPVTEWSQIWKTRIDPGKGEPSFADPAPRLLRPTNGYEFAEATPLLEWFPKTGATSYDVEISLTSTFSAGTIVDSHTVEYPVYVPTDALALRRLEDLNFPIFYWRVRQHGSVTWSETRRFQVAAQSEWASTRNLGELVEPAVVATDAIDTAANPQFELTDLYVAQTPTYWQYGFHVPAMSTPDVTYGIYLDMDGISGSGATVDPRGYTLQTDAAHQPEYAIYLLRESGLFSSSKVYIYHWSLGAWGSAQTLQSLGGTLSQTSSYVEIKGVNSIINYDYDPSTTDFAPAYNINLMSFAAGDTGKPQDSVPDDSKIPTGDALPIVTAFAKVYTKLSLQVGSDPSISQGDPTADPAYDLVDLHAGESINDWYFGWHVPVSPGKPVTYALYLDMDHVVGSGGTIDPKGYTISTGLVPGYLPEFVIYIYQQGGNFLANNAQVYAWNGSGWGVAPASLGGGGGAINQYLNECNNYIEVRVPITMIGSDTTTGSYTVSLLSLQAAGLGTPMDSVPSDPNVPGSGAISRMTNVTERMNLLTPFSKTSDDDTSYYSSIQPIVWDYPILAPYSGAIVKAYLDPGFTSEIDTYTYKTNASFWANPAQFWPNDLKGDSSYWWRLRPNYLPNAASSGVWTQGTRIERKGLVPENLETKVTFATPVFSWDKVEGTETYDLWVATDRGFGSVVFKAEGLAENSYTWPSTLANGEYYWRVRVNRYGGVVTNTWTVPDVNCPGTNLSGCFTLTLQAPTGLSPAAPVIVHKSPTLCWNPIILDDPAAPGFPFFAAWKYRIELSMTENFASTDFWVTEQRCWTPPVGYADHDSYYWRVAGIDGGGILGTYSAPQSFRKQYNPVTLVSPLSGSPILSTPTFMWEPLDGAAYYRLQVSMDGFSTIYKTYDVDTTRYTPVTTYPTGRTYSWRVAMVDADGNIGPYNDATIIYDAFPYSVHLPLIMR